ncbi:hypothetical protein JAAARDRAFT_492843 [Jaapia argillacea MUCL 33604]|uniref:Uncharacterized protein n=1 Tax=Jaapia argillacea MUCL 33604 TaxID=933084 RepID=A0A067PNT1_9AGAM|nr:hypothetical protein JAAARDRAFT_492843 [Jaapia argillacea MUCL 33604]
MFTYSPFCILGLSFSSTTPPPPLSITPGPHNATPPPAHPFAGFISIRQSPTPPSRSPMTIKITVIVIVTGSLLILLPPTAHTNRPYQRVSISFEFSTRRPAIPFRLSSPQLCSPCQHEMCLSQGHSKGD